MVIMHTFKTYGHSSGYLGKPHGSSPNYHHRFFIMCTNTSNVNAFCYLIVIFRLFFNTLVILIRWSVKIGVFFHLD